MFEDFTTKLYKRKGGTQLANIEIYHDFKWETIFNDPKTHFRNGKSLALLVKTDCPENKIPALILTISDETDEIPIETDTHYAAVIKIHKYLNNSKADPAATYFAHNLNKLTQASILNEVGNNPKLINTIINTNLNLNVISNWAKGNIERIKQLKQIIGDEDCATKEKTKPDLTTVIEVLNALDDLQPEILGPLLHLLSKNIGNEKRIAIIEALTNDSSGRFITGAVIGSRIAERIEDVRQAAQIYSSLLKCEETTETDLQEFIKSHPWIIGLDYVKIRLQKDIPRGTLDFILERYDGFYDLLELKSPQDPIIEAPDTCL